MKKHIIFLTLTALLAAFVAACNDNGTDDGGKDDAGGTAKIRNTRWNGTVR